MRRMSAIDSLSIARPPFPAGTDLPAEIRRLKKERNAVILAHYYQESEIQDLADFVGDSLELARRGREAQEPVIAFAGVHFMAETSKILTPGKTVVVPDLEAGCSLADGCPAPLFAEWLKKYPGHTVVSYINCSAAVKALSDVIVTSSSAEVILRQIPDPVVFAPDRNLAAWLEKKLDRKFVVWPGTCVVHETFSEQKLLDLVARHPGRRGHRPPRVRAAHPRARRVRRVDVRPAQARRDVSEAGVHRRDGGRDPPPDAPRGARTRR